MIITRARLDRSHGTSGSLAKVLMSGADNDRSHGLVWSLFNDGETETRRFLYRESEPGSFIVVSEQAPSDPQRLWTIDHKPYVVDVSKGDRLGFVLRANPVVTVPQPGKPRGLRADAIMNAKSGLEPTARSRFSAKDASAVAVVWLVKRSAALGIEVDAAATTADGYQQVRIPRTGHKPIVFSQIDFTGALTVVDPEPLRQALFSGIGKARAYGCGLLLVRRL